MEIIFERIVRDHARQRTNISGEQEGMSWDWASRQFEAAKTCWYSPKVPITVAALQEEPVNNFTIHCFLLWLLVCRKRAPQEVAGLKRRILSAGLNPRNLALAKTALKGLEDTGPSIKQQSKAFFKIAKMDSFFKGKMNRSSSMNNGFDKQPSSILNESKAGFILPGKGIMLSPEKIRNRKSVRQYLTIQRKQSLAVHQEESAKTGDFFLKRSKSICCVNPQKQIVFLKNKSKLESEVLTKFLKRRDFDPTLVFGAKRNKAAFTTFVDANNRVSIMQKQQDFSGLRAITQFGKSDSKQNSSSKGSKFMIEGRRMCVKAALAFNPLNLSSGGANLTEHAGRVSLIDPGSLEFPRLDSVFSFTRSGGPKKKIFLSNEEISGDSDSEEKFEISWVSSGTIEINPDQFERFLKLITFPMLRIGLSFIKSSDYHRYMEWLENQSHNNDHHKLVRNSLQAKLARIRIISLSKTFHVDFLLKIRLAETNSAPQLIYCPLYKSFKFVMLFEPADFSQKHKEGIEDSFDQHFSSLFDIASSKFITTEDDELFGEALEISKVPDYLSTPKVRVFLGHVLRTNIQPNNGYFERFLNLISVREDPDYFCYRPSLFQNFQHVLTNKDRFHKIHLFPEPLPETPYPLETYFFEKLVVVSLQPQMKYSMFQFQIKVDENIVKLPPVEGLTIPSKLTSFPFDVSSFIQNKGKYVNQLQSANYTRKNALPSCKAKGFWEETFLRLFPIAGKLDVVFSIKQNTIFSSCNSETGVSVLNLINLRNRFDLYNLPLPNSQYDIQVGYVYSRHLTFLILLWKLQRRFWVSSQLKEKSQEDLQKTLHDLFRGKEPFSFYNKFIIRRIRNGVSISCLVNIFRFDQTENFLFDFSIVRNKAFIPKRHLLDSETLRSFTGWSFDSSLTSAKQIEAISFLMENLVVCKNCIFPKLGFNCTENPNQFVFLKVVGSKIFLKEQIVLFKFLSRKVIRIRNYLAILSVFDIPELKETWFHFYFPRTRMTFYTRLATSRFKLLHYFRDFDLTQLVDVIPNYHKSSMFKTQGFPLLRLGHSTKLVIHELIFYKVCMELHSLFIVSLMPNDGPGQATSESWLNPKRYWIILKRFRFCGTEELLKISIDAAVALLSYQKRGHYTRQELSSIAKQLVELCIEDPQIYKRYRRNTKLLTKAVTLSLEVVLWPKPKILTITRNRKRTITVKIFDSSTKISTVTELDKTELEEFNVFERDLLEPKVSLSLRQRLMQVIKMKGLLGPEPTSKIEVV